MKEKNLNLNGENWYYGFLSGSKKILEHQQEINKLNVFPVPDADTGTNLASTIRSIMEHCRPNKSFSTTMRSIASAALDGARGNSGVIFAQFLYGISCELHDHVQVGVQAFADAMKNSVRYIHDAIAHPQEGTMFSVIRDWADHLNKLKDNSHNFTHLISESFASAMDSLKKTTSQLEVLKKANVVDAGAKGFVLFLEGMIDFFKNKVSKKELEEHVMDIPVLEIEEAEIDKDSLTYRYCTEAAIEGENLDKEAIRSLAESFGDSLVLAGGNKKLRLHVHTDNPANLFFKLRHYGTLTFQKADDMVKQYKIAHERKWNIGLLTDSACDLPDELMERFQIQMLPINLYFGQNHFLDRTTITPSQFYTLLQESPSHPTTAQVNVKTFSNTYSHMISHYDSVIALHLAAKLSGTATSSLKAAEMISKESGKNISVIDSKNITGALGLLVYRTALEIEAGKTQGEIVRNIEAWKSKTKIFVAPKTMKYFVRGGRVSPMKGLLAKIFHIIPMVSVNQEGKTTQDGMAFSHKGAMKLALKHFKNYTENHKIWNYAITHGKNLEDANKMAEILEEITGKKPLYIYSISPVLGLHAGDGTVTISVMLD